MSKLRASVKFDDFYSRQIVMKELGLRGQKRLARSSVAVVGLGGLGTISALYLALAGIGKLKLIDQDTVELGNLHRQVLYNLDDVLYPKVEASAKKLKKTNPLVRVESVPENFNANNAKRLLSDVDCVIDGLDNMYTRYLVNRACMELRIPYVFGAAIGLEGNLSVFHSPGTPCLECVFPSISDAQLLSCDTRGVLGATPGIIGSMQAMEAVKVLAGIGSPLLGKLLICDFSDMYFASVDVFKRDNCRACQDEKPILKGKERLVWLCGRNTANINPNKPIVLALDDVYGQIKRHFNVRVKSKLAIIFDYKGFEITLFNGGRMLIKNVTSEKSALAAHEELVQRLRLS